MNKGLIKIIIILVKIFNVKTIIKTISTKDYGIKIGVVGGTMIRSEG